MTFQIEIDWIVGGPTEAERDGANAWVKEALETLEQNNDGDFPPGVRSVKVIKIIDGQTNETAEASE